MELILTAGALATALLAVIAFWKWVVPWARGVIRDLAAFKAAVLGRDEVTHPDTGQTLVPAQPGLGGRMATIEVAVTALLQNNRRLDDHEARIGRLEEGAAERTAARTETVELLRVVDTALKTQPPEDS